MSSCCNSSSYMAGTVKFKGGEWTTVWCEQQEPHVGATPLLMPSLGVIPITSKLTSFVKHCCHRLRCPISVLPSYSSFNGKLYLETWLVSSGKGGWDRGLDHGHGASSSPPPPMWVLRLCQW